MARRRVMLAGATGLVGRECLAALVADAGVERVVAPLRRMPAAAPDGKVDAVVVDFDRLDERPDLFRVDDVVCALGTTIKKAGSRQAFRRVDLEYPLAIARLAHAAGARHFVLVSALGADPRSRVFYSRIKGELEQALAEVGFPCLTLIRPSLLLGDRDDFRLGEEVVKRLSWATPARFKPVHARDVAAAVMRVLHGHRRGTTIIESPAITRAAGGTAG